MNCYKWTNLVISFNPLYETMSQFKLTIQYLREAHRDEADRPAETFLNAHSMLVTWKKLKGYKLAYLFNP